MESRVVGGVLKGGRGANVRLEKALEVLQFFLDPAAPVLGWAAVIISPAL